VYAILRVDSSKLLNPAPSSTPLADSETPANEEIKGAQDTHISELEARGVVAATKEREIDDERSPAKMRSSEIRYRRLFEAARDGILIIDPDTRKITDANPFMTELLGYPHEEFLGKELWQIGLLKDEEASRAIFRQLRDKHYVRYEDLPLQGKTGQCHQVEFVSNLYEEDGWKVIQCNIRDITERKRAEEVVQAGSSKEAGRRKRRSLMDMRLHSLSINVANKPFNPVYYSRHRNRLSVIIRPSG
jgi:PAS domain S-box-containing protein